MITCMLNDKVMSTSYPPGATLLDFIREEKQLRGTKIGCREGDCGACTVLIGTLHDDALSYQSMTSCLTPMANVAGKHILTIDSIGAESLTPAQSLMISNNGTQCGFCTPGFVVSMTGFALAEAPITYQNGIKAIDGNICRCTGYKSIERAVLALTTTLSDRPEKDKIQWLVKKGHLPKFMLTVKAQLEKLKSENTATQITRKENQKMFIGGGTDLMVQKPETVKKKNLDPLFDTKGMKGISVADSVCTIGAAATVTDFENSKSLQSMFPDLASYMKLVSSTPIRNMATIAGNLVNASPIGDMTIFLLALDASIALNDQGKQRKLPLKSFYLDYKKLDKAPAEYIEHIHFPVLPESAHFNFEKVSKRTHLDIASVNSACQLQMNEDGTIAQVYLSAGGVGPTPKFLTESVAYLIDKPLEATVFKTLFEKINQEISPISDARGAADYKRLLLRQLIIAHFVQFFGLIPPLAKILSND